MVKFCMKHFVHQLKDKKGILFHIIGILSVIWFTIRVLPAPHRSQYPCQQVAIPLAIAYIGFWSALVFGLLTWIKKVQTKTMTIVPSFLIICLILFSMSSVSFAHFSYTGSLSYEPWDPIPQQPIGTPTGLYPGRVVWMWDQNATERYLDGNWWEPQNNDREVIDHMISQGLQTLTNSSTDEDAWYALFRYFNINHEKEEQGYTPGEKITIKINLNNCWNPLDFIDDYETQDNERDAHPAVVNSLLSQLIDVVGVPADCITIYDASRPMPNWFYDLVSTEHPDIQYVDGFGGAPGRTKAQPSDTFFYFSDGVVRTLPVCVAEADYFINMPLMKQHPINHGVTLSGKNLFGTFVELDVFDFHAYHEYGQIVGNPTPQIDLLSSEDLGGKTLLYLGDGLYSTLNDHRTIYHFQMEPFFDDWTNSLFFSQDPIAIDSVMYDFLHTEGPIPIEGSQNYLHQGAEPKQQYYDPEGDGVYLNESLGVHEHWDTTVPIFSSDRYMGAEHQGIDFIAKHSTSEEDMIITITKPAYQQLYISDTPQHFTILWKDFYTFPTTVIIGDISIQTTTSPPETFVDHVDFSVDGTILYSDEQAPFEWYWDTPSFGSHVLTVTAYGKNGQMNSAERTVLKII